jgi:hypothetical protein
MKTTEFTGRSVEMKKPSPWLASEDILDAGDVEVKISGVYVTEGAVFDDGRTEKVWSLGFEGKEKKLILGSTNRQTLIKKFGTTDTTKWVGKIVVLYVTHDAQKPGAKRGVKTMGIRIR